MFHVPNVIPIIAMIFTFIQIQAQVLEVPLNGGEMLYRENDETFTKPMLFETWKYGILYDHKDNPSEKVLLNYDALNNNLIANLENNTYMALNKYSYPYVLIENNKFVNLNAYGTDCYGRVLYEGNSVSCFECLKATRLNSGSTGYNVIKKKIQIQRDFVIYILYNDELVQLRRKEKDLYKLFGKSTVKDLADSLNISFKKDYEYFLFLKSLEKRL